MQFYKIITFACRYNARQIFNYRSRNDTPRYRGVDLFFSVSYFSETFVLSRTFSETFFFLLNLSSVAARDNYPFLRPLDNQRRVN